MLPLLLGLASPAALADEPTRVFVSELQASDPDAAGLAILLSGYVREVLAEYPELQVIGPDEAPGLGEQSAQVYLDSCPRGEAVGCAFVVGSVAEAAYAVAGRVQPAGEGHRVDVVFIDIEGSREALSFTMDFSVGDDTRFAQGVADLMLGVARGEEGLEVDIRDMGAESVKTVAIDKDAVARQLEELKAELGGEVVGTRTDREVERREYTMDDLVGDMDSDAAKPWERLGMSPAEYLRFKNSGLSVSAWRTLAAGRRFQLLLHPVVGVARGPWGTQYYARSGVDADTLQILETWAWQARTTDTAPTVGGWVGFGLTPTLEVDLGGGGAFGTFSSQIVREVLETPVSTNETLDSLNANTWVGARVLAGLMPTRKVRPVVGAGALYAWGPGVTTQYGDSLPGHLPTFSNRGETPTQLMVFGLGGGELSVNSKVNVYAHVPVQLVLGGRTALTYSDGGNALVDRQDPPALAPLSGQLDVGVTVRLFGQVPEPGGRLPEEDL